MVYCIAYSVNGKLKEVYFTVKSDAHTFYEDIVNKNKENNKFDYATFSETKQVAHFHKKSLWRD